MTIDRAAVLQAVEAQCPTCVTRHIFEGGAWFPVRSPRP